ncbi:hypothetical protein ANCCEY_09845 [Ancylostoma ceylanicum]|uniref:SCP domain-containing protein n=1 Tax=Ancylostoma ceylanicum TaxID=53326 RepID=A0A0D6LIL6_9BILA|nr:hypothetical protein ANCCEY_09845 [Ancylostoma ceylanicum]
MIRALEAGPVFDPPCCGPNDARGKINYIVQQNHRISGAPRLCMHFLNGYAVTNVWDCNLEQEALDAVRKCTAYNGTRAFNEAEITEKPCNVTSGVKSILKEWWNEIVSAAPLKDENKFNKTSIPHFGVMAYFNTTLMACSYDRCDTTTKLLCLYNKK